MLEALKAKRFAQIFAYMDEADAGVVDLLEVTLAPTQRYANLDPEVGVGVVTGSREATRCQWSPRRALLALSTPEPFTSFTPTLTTPSLDPQSLTPPLPAVPLSAPDPPIPDS